MRIFHTLPAVLLTFLPAFAMCAQQQTAGTVTDTVLAADADQYAAFGSGKTVEEIMATGRQFDPKQRVFLLTFHPHEEISPGHEAVADPLIEIKTLTFNSDAAILGTVSVCRSALTATHTFIFSDCEVKIDSIYLDTSRLLSAGANITVSRPGGTVVINGMNVKAVETEYPPFRQSGQYLFFLHKLPSGSYYVGPSDAFSLKNNVLGSARNHPKVDTTPYNFAQIVHAIQAAVDERQRSSR